MELTRINPHATALIRCPAGCLHPDTREPQLLIPYIAGTPPHPN